MFAHRNRHFESAVNQMVIMQREMLFFDQCAGSDATGQPQRAQFVTMPCVTSPAPLTPINKTLASPNCADRNVHPGEPSVISHVLARDPSAATAARRVTNAATTNSLNAAPPAQRIDKYYQRSGSSSHTTFRNAQVAPRPVTSSSPCRPSPLWRCRCPSSESVIGEVTPPAPAPAAFMNIVRMVSDDAIATTSLYRRYPVGVTPGVIACRWRPVAAAFSCWTLEKRRKPSTKRTPCSRSCSSTPASKPR